jgi:hypothetical protein
VRQRHLSAGGGAREQISCQVSQGANTKYTLMY